MDTTTQRYTTPAPPPRLIGPDLLSPRRAAAAPLLGLRQSQATEAHPLVSFAWGRVARSRYGR